MPLIEIIYSVGIPPSTSPLMLTELRIQSNLIWWLARNLLDTHIRLEGRQALLPSPVVLYSTF